MSGDRRPPRGPARPDRSEPSQRAELRRKVQELVDKAGIPVNLAWQVAQGTLSLNEVLKRMATRRRVDHLMVNHGLPKSLATQIALGQADLDHVLRKQRLELHLRENRERSILSESAADGSTIHLGLLGGRRVTGRVQSVGRYDFAFLHVDPRSGADLETETIHKLHCKYGCIAEDARGLRNQIKRDKSRPAKAEPIWKPQERYGCSDRRLFGYLDEEVAVQCTLQEGEMLRGLVRWMGRWEFGLELKKKSVMAVVFRHALVDLGTV
jgi:sRNA-binding regulator protein Hfq